MISKEEHIMLFTLHEQGHSIRSISRITGIDRRTISKRLKQRELEPYKKRNYNSILDPYKEYIAKRYKETLPYKLPCSVILREIKEYGYKGKIRIIQRYLKTLKTKLCNNFVEQDIRFETPKGYQAQTDWTTIRSGRNPIYAFVMVLGYSRYAFVYFTDNMKQETWQDCHIKAFEYFNGIPYTILYDNLKSVVIQRDRYGTNRHEFNDEFLDFCKGLFIPKLCKPYRAKTKGKVERFNSYLKGNFYNPLKSSLANSGININAELLNSHIFSWLEYANNRIHDTTKQKPNDMLKDELPYLNKLHKNIKPISKRTYKELDIKVNIPSIDISYHTTINDYEKLLGGVI